MKIFYDHKIFCKQERGGPSKYFLELTQKLIETNVNAKIFAGFHPIRGVLAKSCKEPPKLREVPSTEGALPPAWRERQKLK